MTDLPKPDLVLLPGWGLPATVLAPLVDALSARWCVHVLALADGASLDALATQALAQAPSRAVWVGWSLGGMVAVAAARAAPQRVRAVAAIGSNLVFVAREDWPAAMPADEFAAFYAQVAADPVVALGRFAALVVRAAAPALRGEGAMPPIPALCSEGAMPPTALEEHRGHGPLATKGAKADLRTLRAAIDAAPSPDPALLLHTLTALRDADLRGATLACPSLWLFGEYDALVPAAAAADIAHCLPGARTRIVAGAAHAPFLSAPVAVAADLDAFFLEFA